jgi:hypothetical protein
VKSMDEVRDIFIYSEGPDRVAYVGGAEIARMSPMGKERFVTALFQWMRQHGERPIWTFDAQGATTRDEDLLKEIQTRK